MNKLAQWIEANWYRPWWHNIALLPLWGLTAPFIYLKRWRFERQMPKENSVPVIVVGNINVGGTGKTPLITYLVQRAQQLGMSPAIVSRGYGGKSKHYPLLVQADTLASECGDEPKLLHSRLGCPVVVSPSRRDAVALASEHASIIFSDDGLQHYRMSRDAEIVVIDAQRRFGNGWLLPIGPLREPISRLAAVDLVLANGDDFTVQPKQLINAKTGEVASLEILANQAVDAVCGIGNPERFYRTLEQLHARVTVRTFSDHHPFKASDFKFSDLNRALIMTEKDWVKCQSFAQPHWWYLTVDAVPNEATAANITQLLQRFTPQETQ